jgi:predicted transposase/invertase (TIGR01784 family)
MDTAINKALDKINHVTQDNEYFRQYNLHEMAMSDHTTAINTAMEKGMEKGVEKVARNLIALKMPIETIAQATGLTEQEIKGLL